MGTEPMPQERYHFMAAVSEVSNDLGHGYPEDIYQASLHWKWGPENSV